ncbi:cytochrome P450 2U1 [Caerostris darwini]|uniref:Cytochrome P450 2U1 n=1 Tax=Caerostris darwini TaxID=1538125 RepID=A0AAV4WAV6_9ARAC|nr:cytochrome P450 2U1 [Caerostris darwini]
MTENVHFLCSTYPVIHRANFVWTLKEFSTLTPDDEKTASVRIPTISDPLMDMKLFLMRPEGEDKIQINLVNPKGSIVEYCSCSVSALDISGRAIESVKKEFLVEDEEDGNEGIIELPPFLSKRILMEQKDRYLPKDTLSLACEFSCYCGNETDISEGFVGMNGDEWHDQRRFTMHTMRDLGLGKGLWETMIQVDAAEYVKKMKKENGKPVIFVEPLALSQIANSLSLLFGRHLDQEQESDMQDILKIRSFTKKMMEKASGVDIGFTLPCLVKIVEFFNLFGFKEFVTLIKNLQEIFQKEVDKRMNSKEEHTSSDFIGCYLQEMEKREQDSKPHTFTRINLQGNLFIMFLSGQDSTLASVSWLLLLMAKHPEVQQKVCDEIDRVIGRDGAVYFSEKGNLPYTTATVFEMMRYISISPFFPNRYVLDSFEFHGYTIPKGSHLVCNNWAISHDPRYFKDPMTFNPERFLVENGTKFEKVKGYGPFSFGKRNCPGEGIAMMTMYLYFVSIMQKFYVRPKDDQPPDMKPVYVGGGLMPKVQPLRFIER